MDPAWLSAALGLQYDGCRVKEVTVLTQTATIASKLRLQLNYENPGSPAAPERICVKGYFGDGASLGSAGLAQALFYRELADIVAVRTPRCHYVGLDERTGSSLLLLEDLARPGTETSHGAAAVQPGRISRCPRPVGCPPCHGAEAGDSGRRMARLKDGTHGRPCARQAAPGVTGPASWLWPSPRGRSGRRVSEAMRAAGRRDSFGAVPSPWRYPCRQHRLENDAAGLFDWQLAQRGSWALDVSYHIASVLETEDRRRHEGDLRRGDLDRRAALGAGPRRGRRRGCVPTSPRLRVLSLVDDAVHTRADHHRHRPSSRPRGGRLRHVRTSRCLTRRHSLTDQPSSGRGGGPVSDIEIGFVASATCRGWLR